MSEFKWPVAGLGATAAQALIDASLTADAFLLDGSNSQLALAVGGGTGTISYTEDDTVSPSIKYVRSRFGGADVQVGDVLGGIDFLGRSGGGSPLLGVLGAQIYAQTGAVLTSGKYPTSVFISTVGSSGSLKERLSLKIDGTSNFTLLGGGSFNLITDVSVLNRFKVEDTGKMTVGAAGITHRINGTVNAPAANVIAITNAPFAGAGTPSAYLRININGTDYVIPLLPGA